MPDGYKISKIYVGTNQVRPGGWKLYTETDLKNNNLGLLTAQSTSWNGNNSRTLASITNDGTNRYYQDGGSWTPCYLRLRSNYSALMTVQAGKNNRMVKLIQDYLYASSSGGEAGAGHYNRDATYTLLPMINNKSGSYWVRITSSNQKVYTSEVLIDVKNLTATAKLFDKSTGDLEYTISTYSLPNQTSGDYYGADCWGSCIGYSSGIGRCGDVHIYYCDI